MSVSSKQFLKKERKRTADPNGRKWVICYMGMSGECQKSPPIMMDEVKDGREVMVPVNEATATAMAIDWTRFTGKTHWVEANDAPMAKTLKQEEVVA